jgi:hypothetical protein
MASAYDPAFDAAVMAAPIVDNASDRLYAIGELEYDGPTCATGDCRAPVDDDGQLCDDCTCPCGCCRGAGGWQQHDGLIVECPRGCMTGGAA